jgi:S-adenosyl methyltransferase
MSEPRTSPVPSGRQVPAEIDTSVASPARIYDYWLGGKDNFPADQEAAQQVIEVFPGIIPGVRANRAFLGRAARYLAGQAGIRQFLDIGTGLPTKDNTHEVAQQVAPESRVVYVDNDPIVLVHARALLDSTPQGATDYVEADVRDADKILRGAAATLDFDKPVAITLLMILMLVEDDEDPYGIVARLLEAVPSGSYLVISHPAGDVDSGEIAKAYERLNERMGATQGTLRGHAEVARFFDGLEMVEPGLVQLHRWRPDPGDSGLDRDVPAYAGVGRKR